MLIRIVKMGFKPEFVNDFIVHFDAHSTLIRQSPGNRHLELWRDQKESNVFFTYSFWESAEDLENYRQSELFQKVWAETKPMFCQKPEAWSVDRMREVGG